MHKSSFAVVFLCYLTVLANTGAWAAAGQKTSDMNYCREVKSQAEIKALLTRWRDRAEKTADASARLQIQSDAQKAAPSAPAGTGPVSFDAQGSGDNLNFSIIFNRRDYVYGMQGVFYTLMGGSAQGQAGMLDTGFWAFLEAALLQLEADHLAGAGFHLNRLKEYDDARDVLCYASSVKPFHPAAHNNLAFTASKQGYAAAAIFYEIKAMAGDNNKKKNHIQNISRYAQQGGLQINVPDTGDGTGGTVGATSKLDPITCGCGPECAGFVQVFGTEFQGLANVIYMEYNTKVFMRVRDMSGNMSGVEGADERRRQKAEKDYEKCTGGCCPERMSCAGQEACDCQCALARYRAEYSSGLQAYAEYSDLLAAWEGPALKDIDGRINVMIRALSKDRNRLTDDQLSCITQWILNTYLQSMSSVNALREELNASYQLSVIDRFETLQYVTRECSSVLDKSAAAEATDYFRKRPPALMRPDSGIGIWFVSFGAGGLELHPDGTAKLDIGAGVKAKFEYNFETGDFGSGVSAGVNLGKIFGPGAGAIFENTAKFEFSVSVHSKNGIRAGVEAGLSPSYGAGRVDPSSLGGSYDIQIY